jgi:hypothetical protein
MASMVVGDLTLESIAPSVNAPYHEDFMLT